ncbi:hypothetical protein HN873_003127 [Arachis hypogaea]
MLIPRIPSLLLLRKKKFTTRRPSTSTRHCSVRLSTRGSMNRRCCASITHWFYSRFITRKFFGSFAVGGAQPEALTACLLKNEPANHRQWLG